MSTFFIIFIPAIISFAIIITLLSLVLYTKRKLKDQIKQYDDLLLTNQKNETSICNLTKELEQKKAENSRLLQRGDLTDVFIQLREDTKRKLKRDMQPLWQQKWEIGGESLTTTIARTQLFQEYQQKRDRMVEKVDSLQATNRDFDEQLKRITDDFTTELVIPKMKLDALALLEWCVLHSKNLLLYENDYCITFRNQINYLVNTYISNSVEFDNTRDEATHEVFLKIWACALFLQNADCLPLSEDAKTTNSIISDLLMPKVQYYLLFDDQAQKKLSDDSFNQKKSLLKKDLMATLHNDNEEEGGKTKSKESSKGKSFVCKNNYLMDVLKQFYKIPL